MTLVSFQCDTDSLPDTSESTGSYTVTGSYWQLLAVTGSYWQLYSYWQLLAVTVAVIQLLAVTGSYCGSSRKYGIIFKVWVHFVYSVTECTRGLM